MGKYDDSDDKFRYPELYHGARRSHPVDISRMAGGKEEHFTVSLTLDDANLIRELIVSERDFGMAIMRRDARSEPGNDMARETRKQLEQNIGRLSDLLLRKF